MKDKFCFYFFSRGGDGAEDLVYSLIVRYVCSYVDWIVDILIHLLLAFTWLIQIPVVLDLKRPKDSHPFEMSSVLLFLHHVWFSLVHTFHSGEYSFFILFYFWPGLLRGSGEREGEKYRGSDIMKEKLNEIWAYFQRTKQSLLWWCIGGRWILNFHYLWNWGRAKA